MGQQGNHHEVALLSSLGRVLLQIILLDPAQKREINKWMTVKLKIIVTNSVLSTVASKRLDFANFISQLITQKDLTNIWSQRVLTIQEMEYWTIRETIERLEGSYISIYIFGLIPLNFLQSGEIAKVTNPREGPWCTFMTLRCSFKIDYTLSWSLSRKAQ